MFIYKSKKFMILAIVLVLIALVSAIMLWFLLSKDTEQDKTYSGAKFVNIENNYLI